MDERAFKEYEDNGVVAMQNIVNEADLESYLYYAQFMKQNTQAFKNYLPSRTFFKNKNTILNIVACSTIDALCKKLGESYRVHLVEARMGSSRIYWHRDYNQQHLVDFVGSNETQIEHHYFGAMFSLENVLSAECGPFTAIIGSHKWNVDYSTINKEFVQENPYNGYEFYDNLLNSRQHSEFQWLPQKGDVVVWNGRTIHKGAEAKDSAPTRHHLVAHYSVAPFEEIQSGEITKIPGCSNLYQ
jgi:hypothetical protein